MLSGTVEGRYRELEKQVKIWLKYERRSSWIFRSAFIAIFIWFVIAMVRGYPFFASDMPSTEQIISYILVLSYISMALYGSAFVERKGLVYRPDADNLMLYHVWSMVKSLEDYHKSKIPAMKEEHRKKAIKSGKELLSTVIEDWTVGDFGLAKKIFGDIVSDISDNLCNRVLPNLERGDEKALEKVNLTLRQFAQYLFQPSVTWLQVVNKSMSETLTSYEPVKLGFIARCSSFFRTHASLKHVMMVVLIFAFSFFPALVGISYLPISADTAFLGFATIFSALIVGYFTYVSKKK